jgi:tellurium resistance protein TerD
MRKHVDKHIDAGLTEDRILSTEKTFQMKKDDSATIPEDISAVLVGLGWSCDGSIDLDASIVLMNQNKEIHETIYFGNKKGSGITHAGDNTTGDGDGDDELIRLDLK